MHFTQSESGFLKRLSALSAGHPSDITVALSFASFGFSALGTSQVEVFDRLLLFDLWLVDVCRNYQTLDGCALAVKTGMRLSRGHEQGSLSHWASSDTPTTGANIQG